MTRRIATSVLECCGRSLVPRISHPRTEGASQKLLIVCEECRRGIEVIGGRLRPFAWRDTGEATEGEPC